MSYLDLVDSPAPPLTPSSGEHVWLWRYTDDEGDEYWGTHYAPTADVAKDRVWRRLVDHSIAEDRDDGELIVWPSAYFMIAGGYL